MMNNQISIPLGFVVARNGQKIEARLVTQKWGGKDEYAVTIGESKAGGHLLPILFDYVLRDGLSDFELLHDNCPLVSAHIPAGEMRDLVRRIMTRHPLATAVLTVQVDVRISRTEASLAPVELPF